MTGKFVNKYLIIVDGITHDEECAVIITKIKGNKNPIRR